jgi:hypothetical protein
VLVQSPLNELKINTLIFKESQLRKSSLYTFPFAGQRGALNNICGTLGGTRYDA